MSQAPKLLSIQVGEVRRMGTSGSSDPMDQPWESAIFKSTSSGPRLLRAHGLEGDRQADRENHGGFDKAVLAYAAAHYPGWRAELGILDLPFGGFGENLTLEGQDESSVCIGDIYSLGAARVQVSQPRQPCWKLARRWRLPKLAARVKETGRTGWYLRVLDEGIVEAGAEPILLARPHPEWTVARAAAVHDSRKADRAAAHALGEIPELSIDWRDRLLSEV